MMTQPIQMFENLTSETSPAGGNAHYQDRPCRSRTAACSSCAPATPAPSWWPMAWPTRSCGSAGSTAASSPAIKADFKLRAAEAQLFRMSDRELADIGLCRGDIHVRDARDRARRACRSSTRVTGHVSAGEPELASRGVSATSRL